MNLESSLTLSVFLIPIFFYFFTFFASDIFFCFNLSILFSSLFLIHIYPPSNDDLDMVNSSTSIYFTFLGVILPGSIIIYFLSGFLQKDKNKLI